MIPTFWPSRFVQHAPRTFSNRFIFQSSVLQSAKMSQKLNCIASPTSWNEDRSQTATPRVTTADVILAFSPLAKDPAGDEKASQTDATTATSYQLTYLPGGNASFVFTETITAKDFLGKQGSFITQGKGTFEAKTYVVKGEFTVVDGTGTAGLEGVKGTGSFGPLEEGSTKLKYDFDLTFKS